jgi:ubiquinone/menaquinone biosynthesis C-methylase UbiE
MSRQLNWIFNKNHVCPWWLAYSFDNPIRKLFHKPQQMLAPYVREGMLVMDMGCGMGFFSIGMAKLVGDRGRVIAVDLQSKMLAVTQKRARRIGLENRVTTHKCRPDAIGIKETVDFILTFWMVHEIPDKTEFFGQLHANLDSKGKLLMAEPKMHVTAKRFQEILARARTVGLQLADQPPIRFSHSAVLEK